MSKFLKSTKIIVDIAMLALLVYLMTYRVTRAIALHALFGTILVVLFVLHHALNFRFYRTLFKGKFKVNRVILIALDILLTISMVLIIASSLGMSSAVIDLGIPMTQTSWNIHVASTSWCFVLTSLHLGFHLHPFIKKVACKTKGTVLEYAIYVILLACVAVGIYSFIKSEIWQNMFLIHVGHSFPSLSAFILQHLGTLLLGTLVMHAILCLVTWKDENK